MVTAIFCFSSPSLNFCFTIRFAWLIPENSPNVLQKAADGAVADGGKTAVGGRRVRSAGRPALDTIPKASAISVSRLKKPS